VTRPFGYCGNDFGMASRLEPEVLDHIEKITVTVGEWLRTFGYRGTFGVDFLVRDGEVLFTEVNPRFQGSTHASCRLAVEEDESCLMLEHVAAHLGLPAPPRRPLRSIVADMPHLAHIVVHWTGPDAQYLDPRPLTSMMLQSRNAVTADVLTRRDLRTHPGAVLARVTVRDIVTASGYDLKSPWLDAIADWNVATAATLAS
jgi:hypothetical protein